MYVCGEVHRGLWVVGLGCFLGSCNVGLVFEMYTPCSEGVVNACMYIYIC